MEFTEIPVVTFPSLDCRKVATELPCTNPGCDKGKHDGWLYFVSTRREPAPRHWLVCAFGPYDLDEFDAIDGGEDVLEELETTIVLYGATWETVEESAEGVASIQMGIVPGTKAMRMPMADVIRERQETDAEAEEMLAEGIEHLVEKLTEPEEEA